MPSAFRYALAGLLALLAYASLPASAAVGYAGTGPDASDSNPGTAKRPVASVKKAVSLAHPGDTVVFRPGTYACSAVHLPDGRRGSADHAAREGKGRVVFTNDGPDPILFPGSYNTLDGLEFAHDLRPPRGRRGAASRQGTRHGPELPVLRLPGWDLSADRAHDLTITNCETAYSGA